MAEKKVNLEALSKLGAAKIAGLTCNKKSPMIVRVDVEVAAENLQSTLEVLGIEATDVLVKDLSTAVEALKKTRKRS